MADEKALIPFKSVNLSLIQKRIDKAVEKTRNHWHTEPVGEDFDAFVGDLFSAFPPTLPFDVFFASVRDLAGKLLTPDVIRDTAWRLAGNFNRLRRGRPCPPFIRQTEVEWCPITIVRANMGRGYNGQLGFFYDYRVMAGQAAGLKFTLFWTLKYARFIARSVGFRRTRKAYFKFTDGTEMVRMRLYLQFDPKLSKEDRPTAYHFYVPSSVKAYNQKILKQRFRVTPCPLLYTQSELLCHRCPKGYDWCIAGCHPKTFIEKPCPRCGKESTWFDPLGRNVVCVDCEEQERRVVKAER